MSAWRTRCGVFAFACVCLFFAPRFAAASHHTVTGDFDGEGRHDRATLDRRGETSEIRVWLSALRQTFAAEWAASLAPNRVEDPQDAPAEDSTDGASSAALWSSPQPRAPDLVPQPIAVPVSARFTSAHFLAPVAPRPPPVL